MTRKRRVFGAAFKAKVASEFSGVKKRLLRVQDLLDRFDQFRATELLDDSAAEMLRRAYV